MTNKLFGKFVLVIFAFLLLSGGLGVETVLVQNIGVFVGILLVVLIWLQKRKILLPPFILLYSLFLLLFLINSFVISVNTKKSLEAFSLFLGGGLFWIISYNLKKELFFYFDKLIILPGLVFAGLYFYNNFFGDPSTVMPWSLYLNYSAYRNHNNIGDLWAVVLVVVVYYFVRNKLVYLLKNPRSVLLWPITLLCGYLLLISQSRSALVALAAGVLYMVKEKGWIGKYKKLLTLFMAISILFFLIIGTQKTTLFTRQYYIQGILGFIHNPEGVGVGNFDVISRNPENHF